MVAEVSTAVTPRALFAIRPEERSTGDHELLWRPDEAPKASDARYVRVVEQPLAARTFNGVWRPLRRVTVTGMTLLIDPNDTHGLARFAGDAAKVSDVAELYLMADSVTISRQFRVPQAQVVIVAREVRFEGKGCLSTEPEPTVLRAADAIDGANGTTGGSVTIIAGNVDVKQATGPCVVTQGSKGQDGGPGKLTPSPTRRTLPAITEKDWDALFSYENCTIPRTRSWPVIFEGHLDKPKWSDYKNMGGGEGHIVYIAITNTPWTDTSPFTYDYAPTYTVASRGTKDRPGAGADAGPGGSPGAGGAGGAVLSTVAFPKGAINTCGGPPGRPGGPTPGGEGGTPSPAYYITWACKAMRELKMSYQVKVENAHAERGREGRVGEKREGGPAGAVEQVSLPQAWMVPAVLAVAAAYARDCLIHGAQQRAATMLEPYLVAPADVAKVAATLRVSEAVLGTPTAQQQAHRDLGVLIEQLRSGVDVFGNPPGWVPSLSLETSIDIYRAALEPSIRQIYAAYVLQHSWNDVARKTDAIDSLTKLLDTRARDAVKTIGTTRENYAKALDLLQQLLTESEGLFTRLQRRKEELEKKADVKTREEAVKAAIAAGFKISSALLKSLPLPEPYRTITAGVGGVADVAAAFVENGPDDDSFNELREQAKDFANDFASNPELLAALDDDKLIGATRTGQDDDARSEADAKAAEATLKDLTAKKQDADDALLKATHAAENAQAAHEDAIRKGVPAEKLAALETASENAQAHLRNCRQKADTLNSECTKAGKVGTDVRAAVDKRKSDREKEITKTAQQVAKLASAASDIGKTINKLRASQSQLNAKHAEALAALQSTDEEYVGLMRSIAAVQERKADATQQVDRLNSAMQDAAATLTKSLLAISELRAQRAKSQDVLDPTLMTYIQSLSRDAHRDLRRYLYYVARAFEYYTMKPWTAVYGDTERILEGITRLEDARGVQIDLRDKSQEEKLRELITAKDRQPALSGDQLAVLRMVYEKPLKDMGLALADDWMHGAGQLLQGSQQVTLRETELCEINAALASSDRPNTVPFSLLRLRQVAKTYERQRIVGIKVVRLCFEELDNSRPDQVTVNFSLAGQSVVRCQNVLYAFDPEVRDGGSGVSYVTTGKVPGGTRGEIALGRDDLTYPDRGAQGGLLSQLLGDKRDESKCLIGITEFRPGVFSALELAVDITPADRGRIKLVELVLELTLEQGAAREGALFVAVDGRTQNGEQLAVGVRVSREDQSGRTYGVGPFVRLYGDNRTPVTLEAPGTFGGYKFVGWSVDGAKASDGVAVEVRKSAYATALYRVATFT